MNLADRIVAFGVGKVSEPDMHGDYMIPCWQGIEYGAERMTTEQFTHSWEVAGALMEKCNKIFAEVLNENEGIWAVRADGITKTREWYETNSLPHAIILACVEALEE